MLTTIYFVLFVAVVALLHHIAASSTSKYEKVFRLKCPNHCNGHGGCNNENTCICYPGYTGPDCRSSKICAFSDETLLCEHENTNSYDYD